MYIFSTRCSSTFPLLSGRQAVGRPNFKCLECGKLLSHSAIPVAHGVGPLLSADSSAFGFFFEPPLMSRFAHSYKPFKVGESICSRPAFGKVNKTNKPLLVPGCCGVSESAGELSAPPNPCGKVVWSVSSPDGLGALQGPLAFILLAAQQHRTQLVLLLPNNFSLLLGFLPPHWLLYFLFFKCQ